MVCMLSAVMADQGAETKPKVENGSVINLVVKDQNDTEVLLRIASPSISYGWLCVWSSRCASCSFAYDDVQVHFKVKTHTKFQKIMEAYASKRSVDVAAIRLLYDGQRLDKNSTPGLYPRL